MKTAIVVLGSQNDENGALSPIAQARCDKALQVYKMYPSSLVLCTGGFGANFNVTAQPHGYYTRQYLIEKGIAAGVFLDIAASRFTIEDATLSKPILDEKGISSFKVVTSDFHMPRVKLIFKQFFSHYTVEFIEADTPLPKTAIQRLIAHEAFAIEREKATFSAGSYSFFHD